MLFTSPEKKAAKAQQKEAKDAYRNSPEGVREANRKTVNLASTLCMGNLPKVTEDGTTKRKNLPVAGATAELFQSTRRTGHLTAAGVNITFGNGLVKSYPVSTDHIAAASRYVAAFNQLSASYQDGAS